MVSYGKVDPVVRDLVFALEIKYTLKGRQNLERKVSKLSLQSRLLEVTNNNPTNVEENCFGRCVGGHGEGHVVGRQGPCGKGLGMLFS